jgi:hypothetical protein
VQLISFLIVLATSSFVHAGTDTQLTHLTALIAKHSQPGAVPADALARNIIMLSRSMHMNATEVAQVMLTESGGRAYAVNKRSHDYGLMQINYRTAARLAVPGACLLDWHCNLVVGMRIMKRLNPICRYNVGTGVLNGDTLHNCRAYSAKLAKLD